MLDRELQFWVLFIYDDDPAMLMYWKSPKEYVQVQRGRIPSMESSLCWAVKKDELPSPKLILPICLRMLRGH